MYVIHSLNLLFSIIKLYNSYYTIYGISLIELQKLFFDNKMSVVNL